MSSNLEKMREYLKSQEEKSTAKFESGPSQVYPFWNAPHDSISVLRFLPDGNANNPTFWVENQSIALTFPGIVGQQPSSTRFYVPCMRTWTNDAGRPERDKILDFMHNEGWWTDPTTKPVAQRYYAKKQDLFHGLVVTDGVQESEENIPANPIRLFRISPDISDILKAAIKSDDFVYSPCDYEHGTDFTIRKIHNKTDKWASYTTSNFKRNERPLTDEELAAIEEYGIPDLDSYRPRKPTAEEQDAIFEMFLASVNGDYYDPAKWGHLPWKPFNVESTAKGGQKASENVSSAVREPVADVVTSTPKDEEPVQNDAVTPTSASVENILARIKQGNS